MSIDIETMSSFQILFPLRKLPRTTQVLLLLTFIGWLMPFPFALAENAAKNPPAPQGPPDVIVFSNGDQLTGEFLRAVGSTVTFKSDMAGEINVPWSKVKELRSSKRFAVLYKNQKFNRKSPENNIPLGTVSVENQMVQVHSEQALPSQAIPFAEVADVIDSKTFHEEIRNVPSFFTRWQGNLQVGATTVAATQDSHSYNVGITLARTIPTATYLPARNRTTISFNGTYGKVTQEGITPIKTAIYHAASERDQYFSSRFYALGQVAFDHNYSQSLDLQQIYGGGIGWTALKSSTQQMDIKATIQYEKQEFLSSSSNLNLNLIGSTFSANYSRKLPRNMVLSQTISYIPAWNKLKAYSGSESNSLTVPVYKKLSFSIGTIDSYLNDPAETTPPTKRNSFQFNTGISYLIVH